MKKQAPLLIGLLLIAIAIFVAAGSSNQDTAPQPESARLLATTFHTTPSPTFTVTLTPTDAPSETPAPTITLIPGWVRIETIGMQLLLPRGFAGDAIHVPFQVQQRENGSILDETILPCELCKPLPGAAGGFLGSDVEPGIRLVKMKVYADPELFPYTILGLGLYDFQFDRPRLVDLGRYRAFRTVAHGPSTGGEDLTKMLYWIEQRNTYWVMIFTSTTSEFQAQLPTFEQIARTLTILP